MVGVDAPALLLVAHGSPDPDWRAPLERVAERARALAASRPVELCFMERSEPSLSQAVERLVGDGHHRIRVVAVLLSGGGRHFKQDLPRAVEELAAKHPEVELTLAATPAGAHTGVIHALAAAVLEL